MTRLANTTQLVATRLGQAPVNAGQRATGCWTGP
jgi:hypothetical protein